MADSRRTLGLAALLIFAATALGAFGTHALKPVLPPARFESFETAVTYQFYMSLGMLMVGILQRDARFDAARLRLVVRMLLVGMALFAGSIYALVAGAPKLVVMIAPFGGVTLMGAWLLFAWTVTRPSSAELAAQGQRTGEGAAADAAARQLPRPVSRAS